MEGAGDPAATESFFVILSVVPDVLPAHVLSLLAKFGSTEEGVQQTIDHLLDDPSYPRIPVESKGKNKRKRSASPDDADGQEWEQGEREWLNMAERGEPTEEYETQAYVGFCLLWCSAK